MTVACMSSLSQAATFGTTSVGGNSGTTSRQFCVRYAPPESGTITSMSVYGALNGGNIGVAIYSDVNSLPNTLLAQDTATSATNAVAQWYTNPISLQVTNGRNYFLCFWADAVFTYYYNNVNGTAADGSIGATWESWPGTFTLNSTDVRTVSIYATYTPASSKARITNAKLSNIKL